MATASTTSIKLDSAIKARVERLAATRRRSPHWLMKEAVEQYLDREEKRQQFYEDGLAAWEHSQTTGLHLTGEEVDAWMKKVIAGKKAVMPKCHV